MTRLAAFGIVLVSGGLLLSSPGTPPRAGPEDAYGRAIAEFRRGMFAESLAAARRAGFAWRRRPDAEWHWNFRLLEADSLIELAEDQAAHNLLETGADDCGRYPRLEVRRRVLLAKLLLRASAFDRAAALLEETRAYAEQRGTLVPDVDVLRGQLLARQNRMDDAKHVLRQAQASATASGDDFQYALAANNLGMVGLRQSQYDEAILYFQKALEIFRKLGAEYAVAGIANNLGLCYASLGDFDRALEYRQEALRLAKPSARMAEVLAETGRLYLEQRRPLEAIPYFRRSLEASKRYKIPSQAARSASNLASALIEAADWDAAEQMNREALALQPEPRSIPFLLLNRAAIAAGRGNFEEARKIFEQSIAANPGDPAVLWQAHAGLASLFLASGDWERASQSFEAGIQVVEQSRSELRMAGHKITFLARLIRFYQEYVDALMERNRPLRALEVADSSRARVLAEGLSLKSELPRGARGEEQLKALARRTGSIWLSYWVAPRRSFLWVIAPDRISSFVLPPEAEIAAAAERYRGFIETSMRDPLVSKSDAGEWLFRELIAKAREVIPAGSRVVIVPDGPLDTLNLETLPVYDSRPRYWIEDAALTVAPSLGVCMGQTRRPPGNPRSVLIIGDTDSPGPEFPKLPYAAVEIAAVARRFAETRTTTVSGSLAQPGAYGSWKPGEYALIHVAAHAEANRRSPLDSALILSPGPSGFKLYARDVMQVPLRADLVTLSACRSSGARAYAGEGLVGLARAFLQAGANSVIAGLWEVSDRSASELMDHMYGDIRSGVPGPEALRRAKLSLLKSAYAKPYYWGPFQFYTRRPLEPAAAGT